MMLATWLVEIYLSKCNTLEDIVAAESATTDVEHFSIERQMMEEDMRNFVTTYQHDLEPKVVYELILSHGRTDLYLFYANLNRDHGKVVEHWVTEEQWLKAIDTLNRQVRLISYFTNRRTRSTSTTVSLPSSCDMRQKRRWIRGSAARVCHPENLSRPFCNNNIDHRNR